MNSTRLKLAVLVGVVAGLGCVPDRSSIEYTGSYAPDITDDCTWEGETVVASLAGSLNIGASLASGRGGGYRLVVSFANTLPSTEVISGSTTTSGKNRNDFVITEAEFSYACGDTATKCAGFKAPADTMVKLSGYLPANGTGNFLVDLFTTEAAQALADWEPTEPVTIIVGMKFKGDYVSGASHETDTINFPITVYSSTPSCTEGSPVFPACLAVYAQDGYDSYACE